MSFQKDCSTLAVLLKVSSEVLSNAVFLGWRQISESKINDNSNDSA